MRYRIKHGCWIVMMVAGMILGTAAQPSAVNPTSHEEASHPEASEMDTGWALKPLRVVQVPAGGGLDRQRHEMDRFILAKLEEHGLQPATQADPRTLVRRLYHVLLGLPAPVEVIESFAMDSSPEAWGRLVERLLASAHYGERWARHWMDVVRFGESGGFEYNTPRESAWHYRDWLIRAFNSDLPYDRFVKMQLAGDLIQPQHIDGMAAVGFLVAGVHNEVLGKNPNMKMAGRQDELEEIAGVVGQSFLGMTVQCARCHDHKFDPISAKEYYQFIAALDGVHHGTRPLGSLGEGAMFTVIASNPGPMRVHDRGDVRLLGETVSAGGLSAIQGLPASWGLTPEAPDAMRRKRLAEWITSRENPLFHRVVVNRIWHYHFGRGLVASPNDFGANGERPSHPELLDWLAAWFRDHDYSIKALHRLILSSATWQQTSARQDEEAARIDETNRLLWRQHARRIDAETLRDSLLVYAGVLNRTMYGPGFKDVLMKPVPPAHYYEEADPVGVPYHRRTIYRWHVRGQRSALLDTFDCPDPSVTTPVRHATTTAAQALSQWNHPFVLRMAGHCADRIIREVGLDPIDQATRAWRLILQRDPDPKELMEATRLIQGHGLPLLARTLFNSNESIWMD